MPANYYIKLNRERSM